MNWKRFSEEKPNHGEEVLLCIEHGHGFSFTGCRRVYNAYQFDKKYNPEYWHYESSGREEQLKEYHLWCRVELPDKNQGI